MGAVVARIRRVRACAQFKGYGKLCRACEWSRLFHRVSCSECGGTFPSRPGANSNGYSHCVDHKRSA